MKLYGYWRSTAAYRVRIALALKELAHDNVSVHLVKDGGEQFKEPYVALNPAKLVPTLVDELNGEEVVINQSMAILEYLEDKQPDNYPLLPRDIVKKAQVRAMALDIGCDIHPLNNLRILKYLAGELGVADEQKSQWYAHWIQTGFAAIEAKLTPNDGQSAGKYCFGDEVTMADVFLIPQLYNAHRFNIDISAFPRICQVEKNCNALPAFIAAAPESQRDAD
ncbi:MAG: maleylpyruvate isomerase [Alteromonadaceae bacterium]|jgi:maleylpyruvate isomerase